MTIVREPNYKQILHTSECVQRSPTRRALRIWAGRAVPMRPPTYRVTRPLPGLQRKRKLVGMEPVPAILPMQGPAMRFDPAQTAPTAAVMGMHPNRRQLGRASIHRLSSYERQGEPATPRCDHRTSRRKGGESPDIVCRTGRLSKCGASPAGPSGRRIIYGAAAAFRRASGGPGF